MKNRCIALFGSSFVCLLVVFLLVSFCEWFLKIQLLGTREVIGRRTDFWQDFLAWWVLWQYPDHAKRAWARQKLEVNNLVMLFYSKSFRNHCSPPGGISAMDVWLELMTLIHSFLFVHYLIQDVATAASCIIYQWKKIV